MKIIKRLRARKQTTTTNKQILTLSFCQKRDIWCVGPSLGDNTEEESLESLTAITLIAKSENSKIENEDLEQN